MEKFERHDLKCDIRVSRQDNFYHFFDFLNTWIYALCQSIISFGFNSKATKETYRTLSEYFQNLKLENSLYTYLYRHSRKADNETVGDYLQSLFELSEETFSYYINFLEEILVACDLRREYRIKRDSRDFLTLLESNEFFQKLLEIVIDENDILEYLKVNKKFINYLNENDLRVIYVNYNIEREKEHIGVNLKFDKNDNLQDIKIFVPTIINLETALIYCHEMAKAFEFYKFIGKRISLDDEKGILEYANIQAEAFEISYHEREKKLLPYK
ncbi:MAG: hypothetical protein OSJ70_07450 [Bacilli bacterium]|nr:hypothetical protein [Bacilli bacterium]